MARKRDAREGCPDTDGADGLGGEGLLKLGGCQYRKVTLLYQRQEVLISGDQRIGLSGHSQLEKGHIRRIPTHRDRRRRIGNGDRRTKGEVIGQQFFLLCQREPEFGISQSTDQLRQSSLGNQGKEWLLLPEFTEGGHPPCRKHQRREDEVGIQHHPKRRSHPLWDWGLRAQATACSMSVDSSSSSTNLARIALARWMQHDITVYHLRVSSDGSSS